MYGRDIAVRAQPTSNAGAVRWLPFCEVATLTHSIYVLIGGGGGDGGMVRPFPN